MLTEQKQRMEILYGTMGSVAHLLSNGYILRRITDGDTNLVKDGRAIFQKPLDRVTRLCTGDMVEEIQNDFSRRQYLHQLGRRHGRSISDGGGKA